MDLYQAIMNRSSARRYRDEPLDKDTLALIDDMVDHARPLVLENRFRVMRRDVVSGEDLILAMGGYGRVLSPPHYLVAYVVGDRAPLVDLGYRMEQIVISMVQVGISTCFIGSLGRETDVRVRFRLNRKARTGAFLIFGRAAASVTDRAINAVIRRASGGAGKRDAKEAFYDGSFENAASPPKELTKIVDAGYRAPSANNVRPWRLLWSDHTLYLFVQKHNARYGSNPVTQDYRYFDAGTCMANVTLAMETLDIPGKWTLLSTSDRDIPEHPDTLEPVARLSLG